MERLLLIFITVLLLTACGLEPHLDVLSGNAAYSLGDFQEANIRYLRGYRKESVRSWFSYNLGNVYYALGEGGAAEDAWNAALSTEIPDLQFRVFFNKGVYAFDLGQYDLAYNHFREALILNPGSLDAKRNLEITLKKLDAVQDSSGDQFTRSEEGAQQSQELFRILDYVRRNEHFEWKSDPQGSEEWVKDW